MIILTLTLATLLLLLTLRFGWAGLARMAELEWRGGSLALIACLAQVVNVFLQQHRFALLVLSASALVGFCWLNRRKAGMLLVTIGIALNTAAMAANGGMMPIAPDKYAQMSGRQVESGTVLHFSKDIVLEDHEAALPWLGDRLLLPGPLARLAVWSIGDVLLIAGVARLLWITMKGTWYEQALAGRATSP